MRNLISEAISPAGHFWQCRCKFSGKGVSQRCWNQFGYLFHTWFARVLSAGKPQSAFHRVFHGFMEWVVEIFYSTEMGFDLLHFLWPAPLSLTCSTFFDLFHFLWPAPLSLTCSTFFDLLHFLWPAPLSLTCSTFFDLFHFLWPAPLSLTCSTFFDLLHFLPGLHWWEIKRMVSVCVSLVIPSMTVHTTGTGFEKYYWDNRCVCFWKTACKCFV